ncbi:MAG: hypothetical protein ABL904_01315 [Hyphomicrobiaceae bacterium]
MRYPLVATLFAIAAMLAGSTGHAQHAGAPTAKHGQSTSTDGRELVHLPPPMVDHMLSNMRDHLLALQEMLDAMAKGEMDRVAEIAERRLGMTSLQLHGAHDMSKFMPKGMQDAGSGMHRAANRLAVAATDAGVTGDLKPALAAMATVTAQCAGCHAGYRVK